MTNNLMGIQGKNEAVALAADAAVTEALESLARRMRCDSIQAVECLRQRNQSAWSDFFYDLSKQVAKQIGVLNEEVKAAYIDEYDFALEDHFFGETARTTVIFLFLWVQDKDDNAMETLVGSLDRALVQKFNKRIGKPQITHLLEVRTFDDTDAKDQAGIGGWLNSKDFYLTEIWRQEGVKVEYSLFQRKDNQ